HMILSHHGTYEFGSPKLPMTPEAIALHHLDNFDAKVHSFTRDIREDRNQESSWTPFNQSLQRRLFKGATNGAEGTYTPTLEGLDCRAPPRDGRAMSTKPQAPLTLADYVVGALSPALIMALVGSLVFFLLEVLYVGAYSSQLQWGLFFFVFAAVLIA